MSIADTLGDDRGRLRPMPPPELIEHDAIREAIDAFHAADAEARRTAQDATQLEQERPQAVKQDETALADAIVAGKPDPGAKATAKHDAKIADAQRRAGAAKIVRDRALDNLRSVVAENEDEWQAQVAARFAAVREDWDGLLDQLADVHTRLAEVTGLAAYLRRGGGWRPVPAQVPLRHSSDHRATATALIDALRSAGQPSEPESEHSGGLRVVERAA
jgi:hypothetical protein